MSSFVEIKTELESFACYKNSQKESKSDETGNNESGPWKDHGEEEALRGTLETRQHAFYDIWHESLDPTAHRKSHQGKWASTNAWLIDWKKWPPNYPPFAKGIKIPTKEAPQYDLRLSSAGNWEEIEDGTTVVPVHYAQRKVFDDHGGHLNAPRSNIFIVKPSSLVFLHSKVGQSYTRKLHLINTGNVSRRVTIFPPANSCFTVMRNSDQKDLICPGFHHTITVTFRPKSAESINESILFLVEKDGSIVVPLMTSVAPQPILEVEEWNCGCCVVGVHRTSKFEIRNIGGVGRFWIISEREFTNEFLECYLKFKKDLIKDSTRELVKMHKEAFNDYSDMSRTTIENRRKCDSMADVDKPCRKLKPKIFTNCFRVQPSCFRLQRNQGIRIKVRFQPNDACFHCEKLCILCDNGQVRWIAVKGIGIERDSDKLVELKAPWTGPPVDLPTDPRTKHVLDCGDMVAGEVSTLQFSIINKSCIPLYFFWTIRPVLTNPEASPDKEQTSFMGRFFETTIYDVNRQDIMINEYANESNEGDVEMTEFPLTVSPAQGLIEPNNEYGITFSVGCPHRMGYHACVISLFVEQVDEESKEAVLTTLKGIGDGQLQNPLGKVDFLNLAQSDDSDSGKEVKSKHDEFVQLHPPPQTSGENEEDGEDNFIPLKDYIAQVKDYLSDQNGSTVEQDQVLPLAVAKRSSHQQVGRPKKHSEVYYGLVPNSNGTGPKPQRKTKVEGEILEERLSAAKAEFTKKKESINIHYLPENYKAENERHMHQGHGVFEELKNYTENMLPQYKMWPNREKVLCPVSEVEIWLNSVPLDVTFSPPILLVTGKVPSVVERLVQVRNGTCHDIDVKFQSINQVPTGSITYLPQCLTVKAYESAGLKIFVHFSKSGEYRGLLHGYIHLPFATIPCCLTASIRGYGPFLDVITPTLNFGIVPFSSETMKTLAIRNPGDRPVKWAARISALGMQDENKREISGHQTRINDKRLLRLWPQKGIIDPGETLGIQVYFCAEMTGEVATYIEVTANENPEGWKSVPVYAEIELPALVLENGLIKFLADEFLRDPVQYRKGHIINPSGFSVHYNWQCPLGKSSNLCKIKVVPRKGVVSPKTKVEFTVIVESLSPGEELELDNLFLTCCVEGMKEPLVLKVVSNWKDLEVVACI